MKSSLGLTVITFVPSPVTLVAPSEPVERLPSLSFRVIVSNTPPVTGAIVKVESFWIVTFSLNVRVISSVQKWLVAPSVGDVSVILGGSKETILKGKSGFLYKHDDPRQLAKALNTVIELDQDTLNSIGIEGRKNVIRKFDVENMCKSTFNAYKKILNI